MGRTPYLFLDRETRAVNANEMLPQISSLAGLVRTGNLSGLIANLDVPVSVLLTILSVSISLFLYKLPSLRVLHSFPSVLFPFFVLPTSPRLSDLSRVGH